MNVLAVLIGGAVREPPNARGEGAQRFFLKETVLASHSLARRHIGLICIGLENIYNGSPKSVIIDLFYRNRHEKQAYGLIGRPTLGRYTKLLGAALFVLIRVFHFQFLLDLGDLLFSIISQGIGGFIFAQCTVKILIFII